MLDMDSAYAVQDEPLTLMFYKFQAKKGHKSMDPRELTKLHSLKITPYCHLHWSRSRSSPPIVVSRPCYWCDINNRSLLLHLWKYNNASLCLKYTHYPKIRDPAWHKDVIRLNLVRLNLAVYNGHRYNYDYFCTYICGASLALRKPRSHIILGFMVMPAMIKP